MRPTVQTIDDMAFAHLLESTKIEPMPLVIVPVNMLATLDPVQPPKSHLREHETRRVRLAG